MTNSTNPNVPYEYRIREEKELYVQFPRDATRGVLHFTVP